MAGFFQVGEFHFFILVLKIRVGALGQAASRRAGVRFPACRSRSPSRRRWRRETASALVRLFSAMASRMVLAPTFRQTQTFLPGSRQARGGRPASKAERNRRHRARIARRPRRGRRRPAGARRKARPRFRRPRRDAAIGAACARRASPTNSPSPRRGRTGCARRIPSLRPPRSRRVRPASRPNPRQRPIAQVEIVRLLARQGESVPGRVERLDARPAAPLLSGWPETGSTIGATKAPTRALDANSIGPMDRRENASRAAAGR